MSERDEHKKHEGTGTDISTGTGTDTSTGTGTGADTDTDTDGVLAEVGPRLRRIRKERGATLAGLSSATGISVSTLSRLESGLRKPSLELLLPIARAHQVPLDELVGAPEVGDPRIRAAKPIVMHGRTHWPLTRQPGGLQAYKVLEPRRKQEPDPRTHEGYEWLYVLSGRLRLVLGEHDVVLGPGEAAEFDTRVPHWFGSTGEGPVEFLSLFGRQGERMHVRARPKKRGEDD
ncbi:transcriptional regulator with XRE-family HTH domain [Streptomyces umbrinus]|uniref:Transcriptional regulator with XRE-family HTH domain n=1 Tax=Streptomyces umbrinus TaxID=67370 RepID=A0ABU0T726_9ACTN|nr:XRE family transcriptional regulator [Streptomyces umbrinus]MDQ1031603.1 transcriptional regulator with XRE-family HTH domain [Streptomyces umbrinus]